MVKKEIEIVDLAQKYEKMNRKTDHRIGKLEKQIKELEDYYNKSYEYTIWRVNDIDAKVGSIFHHVNEETLLHDKIKFTSQISYVYDLIREISIHSASNSSALKLNFCEEVEKLEEKLKVNYENMLEIDFMVDDMKYVRYANEDISHKIKEFKK